MAWTSTPILSMSARRWSTEVRQAWTFAICLRLVSSDTPLEKRMAGSRSGAATWLTMSSAGGKWTWQCTSMQNGRRPRAAPRGAPPRAAAPGHVKSTVGSPFRIGAGGSARLPAGRALLGEGPRPLHGVLGAAHALGLGVGELEGDVEGMAEPGQRGLLARADRQRRALEDVAGPAQRGGHQLGQRHHLVDHAQAMRLLRGHVAAGEDVAHRDLLGD